MFRLTTHKFCLEIPVAKILLASAFLIMAIKGSDLGFFVRGAELVGRLATIEAPED